MTASENLNSLAVIALYHLRAPRSAARGLHISINIKNLGSFVENICRLLLYLSDTVNRHNYETLFTHYCPSFIVCRIGL